MGRHGAGSFGRAALEEFIMVLVMPVTALQILDITVTSVNALSTVALVFF
jgi:hypothetical protein